MTAIAFGLSFVLSCLAERFSARRDAPPPSLAAIPARAVLFGLLLLVFVGSWGRPLLGAVSAFVTVAVTTAVSHRKRQLVGEPLNFSDFGLLRMIVRHPDLYYMGFMARPPFLLVAAAFLGLLGFCLWAEPAYGFLSGPTSVIAIAFVAALVVVAWRIAPVPGVAEPLRRLVPAPDPERHVGRWGLLLTLAIYALRWRAEIERDYAVASPDGDRADHVDEPPLDPDRVVVVQFESFLDPARSGLAPIRLPGLAKARELAVLHGPLRVPAHGAFTMRSEHAVLSGLSDAELGFRRFDPYLTTRGPAPDTLAGSLRARGFRTVFLHPFRAGFFGRDRVVPRLGFDRLVFEDGFAGDERIGPYVSDRATARRVLLELQAPGRAFVCAVTMENHGPWGPGRFPDESDPTRQYLGHLAGSDAAIDVLLDGLSALPGTTLLCLYGDHPPILPGVVPSAEPETDYAVLLVGAPPSISRPPRPMRADQLGRTLRRLAGPPAV